MCTHIPLTHCRVQKRGFLLSHVLGQDDPHSRNTFPLGHSLSVTDTVAGDSVGHWSSLTHSSPSSNMPRGQKQPEVFGIIENVLELAIKATGLL